MTWRARPCRFTLSRDVRQTSAKEGCEARQRPATRKTLDFSLFKTSPEVIRLAVMLYLLLSFSLWNPASDGVI